MKRIGIVGLGVVAAFAMSVVAVTGASAAEVPTYQVCKKASPKESGNFNNKTCTVESEGGKKEGDYELGEWNEGKEASPKFKGTNSGVTLMSYIEGFGGVGTVTCKKAKDVGEITGPTMGTVTVRFVNCESSHETCTSSQAGEKAGDITTNKLVSLLVLLAPGRVGIKILAAGLSGDGEESAAFAELSCGAEKVKMTGSVTGEVTGDVNAISKESGNVFALAENKYEQSMTFAAEGEAAGTSVLHAEIIGVGTFPVSEDTSAALKGEEMEVTLPPLPELKPQASNFAFIAKNTPQETRIFNRAGFEVEIKTAGITKDGAEFAVVPGAKAPECAATLKLANGNPCWIKIQATELGGGASVGEYTVTAEKNGGGGPAVGPAMLKLSN